LRRLAAGPVWSTARRFDAVRRRRRVRRRARRDGEADIHRVELLARSRGHDRAVGVDGVLGDGVSRRDDERRSRAAVRDARRGRLENGKDDGDGR
ncbi:predicted protein, partial [Ostreococcus lucimarinus CCE9901]